MRLSTENVHRLRVSYEGRTVCVTGGAGFIGGHLVDALLSVGATVRVIDDLSNSTLEYLSRQIEKHAGRIRFVHGSILDDESLADAMQGCSIVFHLAAMGSVARSVEEPQRAWEVNATGTLRVLEAARAAGSPGDTAGILSPVGVERVVFAASSAAYGEDPVMPRVETAMPMPMSPYAASKLAGESLLRTWSLCYGLSTVSMRYFNVYGPRQSADSEYAAVIPKFAQKLLSGHPPVIFGDGAQSRDFTSVADAVLASMLAGTCSSKLMGDVFNVGSGRSYTVAQLAAKLSDRLGKGSLRPVFEPARRGDVRDSLADVSRAREVLGYSPSYDLDTGLNEMFQNGRPVEH